MLFDFDLAIAKLLYIRSNMGFISDYEIEASSGNIKHCTAEV
jgi:hypothetical protein